MAPKWCLPVLFVLAFTAANAQIQNNSPLYVGDNGVFFMGAGTYYFGAGAGQTKTSRTASTYGKLIFSPTASTSGASDTHFLDGYGSIQSTSPFVFPIGQTGVYAPAKVTASSTAAVDAAYYRTDPASIGALLDGTLSAVSPIEYWNIKGTNSAVVSLSWRPSSNLTSIGVTNAMDNLTIVGYDGSKWVKIPSTVDPTSLLGGSSSITTGSITSTATVNLGAYSYFALGTGNTLGTPDFDTKSVIAILNKQLLQVAASEPITNVSVYDLSGRLVTEIKGNNQLEMTSAFRFAEGVYIAKIKMNTGAVATQKLINNN